MLSIKAILVGDIHLSYRPPLSRSNEPNWFDAMKRQLDELRELKIKHCCPIICTGDIFDKWNAPAELINFALDHLPEMYSIPGNHDLPLHNLADIEKSAYWTLVRSGIVHHLEHKTQAEDDYWKDADNCISDDLAVYAFPYGIPPVPVDKLFKKLEPDVMRLAVVHHYIWAGNFKHQEAKESDNFRQFYSKLEGYDVAAFGDNHKGFRVEGANQVQIFNNGTFFRRTMDEKNYEPFVGLLRDDGYVDVHHMDVSQDKFIDPIEVSQTLSQSLDVAQFMDELEGLQQTDVDFIEYMRRKLSEKGMGKRVRKLLLQALEE